MEITYTWARDYFLPDNKLLDPPTDIPLGGYARMRRAYLRDYRPILYNQFLLSEKLFSHLRELDEAAQHRLDVMGAMYRREAEEVILSELVYG
jgi:hypothetical protein